MAQKRLQASPLHKSSIRASVEEMFRHGKMENESLAPPSAERQDISDGERSDNRCGSFSDDDEFEDDGDDGDFCITLDSDDNGDTGSLSGLHINLKTLQQVSTMLAHYSPIIQSDVNGNPMFVAPPPPPEEQYFEEIESLVGGNTSLSPAHRLLAQHQALQSDSQDSTITGEEDFHCALQELEDVIDDQDETFLSDAMTKLTDVMERMTYISQEPIDDI